MNSLTTYLVGGAVRDQLLGLPTKDRDWVIVGSTPEHMRSLGFKQVGEDFPVFLHPESQEEYALARLERKSGQGYTGFQCDSSASVTLEEDLLRRDLTINAMAQDRNGRIIDPYGGKQDLEDRILRHVSPAFSEDPLRILRLARFYARFKHLGFSVDNSTKELCREIVQAGEVQHLVAERVWQETRRALSEPSASAYFELLREFDCLSILMPELGALFGVPQPEKHHPEIDCGLHALLSMEQAKLMSPEESVWYAALVHDLGKALTPPDQWPRHFGHEQNGVKAVKSLNKRLKVPKEHADLALLACEFHTHIHRALELRAETVLKVFKRCDLFRKPERFEHILLVAEADARGRTGLETERYPQAQRMRDYAHAAKAVDIKTLLATGLTGKELGEYIDHARTRAIEEVKKRYE